MANPATPFLALLRLYLPPWCACTAPSLGHLLPALCHRRLPSLRAVPSFRRAPAARWVRLRLRGLRRCLGGALAAAVIAAFVRFPFCCSRPAAAATAAAYFLSHLAISSVTIYVRTSLLKCAV
jgi:hypothetical protein